MIERADLKAAVGAGILSEAQAVSVLAIADKRRGARENLAPEDEPFELFRGFNEIFIVIGLSILATGWIAFVTLNVASQISNITASALLYGCLGGVILWALSEYFIRVRRMVAPAIALSVLFAANATIASVIYLSQPFMVAQSDYGSLPLPLTVALVILAVFWWRFRVPFALAIIAVGLFALAIIQASTSQGAPENLTDLFLLSAAGQFAWITLALGALVFVGAMLFDMSDPHRVTRRSANGFWLHLVAAPALVNTVALSLLESETSGSDLLLLAILLGFGVTAIIIDRRSFLIAGIGYVVVIASTVMDGSGTPYIILLLGIALLSLGAFWERIRGVMIGYLPERITRRLPPSSGALELSKEPL
ncbi:MAG: hypothetical protein AAF307_05815 [Pseudomonadota bacterium]